MVKWYVSTMTQGHNDAWAQWNEGTTERGHRDVYPLRSSAGTWKGISIRNADRTVLVIGEREEKEDESMEKRLWPGLVA